MKRRNIKRGLSPKTAKLIAQVRATTGDTVDMGGLSSHKQSLHLAVRGKGIMEGFGEPGASPMISAAKPMPPMRYMDPDAKRAYDEALAKMLATQPPKVLNLDRKLDDLFEQVPGGTFIGASDATGELTFTDRTHLIEPRQQVFGYADATGPQQARVITATLTEDQLTRSDEAVSRIVDERVNRELVSQIRGHAAALDVGLAQLISVGLPLLLSEYGIYPAFYFGRDIVRSKTRYNVYNYMFAICWMYEDDGLGDDDDTEDE